MKKAHFRKHEDPFGSVSEGILKDNVYIVGFIATFEDGIRLISVGIKHRNYVPTQHTIDEFEAVTAVVSPKDNYSEDVETKIILGRMRKGMFLPVYLDMHGIKPTKKFIETIAEIIAFGVVHDLSKRYKHIYKKVS